MRACVGVGGPRACADLGVHSGAVRAHSGMNHERAFSIFVVSWLTTTTGRAMCTNQLRRCAAPAPTFPAGPNTRGRRTPGRVSPARPSSQLWASPSADAGDWPRRCAQADAGGPWRTCATPTQISRGTGCCRADARASRGAERAKSARVRDQAGGRALGEIAQARDAAETEAEVHDEAAERGRMHCDNAAPTLRRRVGMWCAAVRATFFTALHT